MYLKGDYAVGNSISIAYAKSGQALDAGAKMIHLGKYTKSNILSKSIAEDGEIKCDTILMDEFSKSDTYPNNIVENNSSLLSHEAAISKIDQEKLFYLMSKGLSEERAKELFILGFISDFKKALPMEYAVELNRLLEE